MPILETCVHCGRIVARRFDGLCDVCSASPVGAARRAARRTPRKRASDRLYSSWAWRRLRLVVLDRDGHVCRWCGDVATEADHVVPRALGGADLDINNLVASCKQCNAGRTANVRRP